MKKLEKLNLLNFMKTNKIFLFSWWVCEDLNPSIKYLEKLIPKNFFERIILIESRPRLVANTFFDSLQLGRIGKKTYAYDYYIEINQEGFNNSQIVAMDSFWIGFCAGRESKKWFN